MMRKIAIVLIFMQIVLASAQARMEVSVKTIMGENSEQLSACVPVEPTSQKINMHFTINANGEVQRVGVGEGNMPLVAKACLVEVIYKINFNRLSLAHPLKVTLPLQFN